MTDYSNLSREEMEERLRAFEQPSMAKPIDHTPGPVTEEKYESLFNNMVEEVHFWELLRDDAGSIKTWRLVDINPAAERSWGMRREDIIGKTADEIFSTATEIFMPTVVKIFSEKKPYSWETYFPDLDQHMRMTSVPFGEYFFTTGFDVSEIKKSSIRQEKLSLMARIATESSEIGVWELDLESGHLTWNEQMSVIFGTDPKALSHTAQDWSDRLHPDDKSQMVAKLGQCIETGEKFIDNFRIVTPSGETRIIKARAEILKNETSDSRIMVGTNIDITAQELLIGKLQEANELANRSNAAKSEFLASMSHELRTPMNGVLGYTQMLQLMADDRLNDKEKLYLDHILESGHHLLRLINDVLELSQIEAGSFELNEEDLDILDVLTQVETIIQPISEKRGITIECSYLPSCSPHIRSDPIRVNQILINLLSNAVKYSPQGGHDALDQARRRA